MKARARKRKRAYKEGTWFAVPLKAGRYGIGRIARHAPAGRIVFAYLFPAAYRRVPALAEIENLRPRAAVKILRIGDLALIDGA